MRAEEALAALAKMKQDALTKRMIKVVKATGRVPLWIENEIRFDKISSPRLEGNTSGNAVICEDNNYHGGYTE